MTFTDSFPDSNIETHADWNFTSLIDSEYRVKVTFINFNIVHLDVSGYTNDGNQFDVWPKVASLIKERFADKQYYLVHNYKNFKGGDSKARNYYIQWINDNIKQIKSVYFYHSNPFHKILINAGKLFSNKLKNTYIFNSLEQVLNHINDHDSSLAVNIPEKVVDSIWTIDNEFLSKTNSKYKIKQCWFANHSNKKARFETYLINDNIFIRRYFGIFEDNSMSEMEADFNSILSELNMLNQKFHAYYDFEHVKELSLGFRKNGLSWFINHQKNIITSGFFNLTPILQIQIKIARSFSPIQELNNKVALLDRVENIFEEIEKTKSSAASNIKETLHHQFDNYTKDQLIEELLKSRDESKQRDQQRDKEITNIYRKLGRVSWDENYEFNDQEIEDTDNPYADVNNAIILIQEDIKQILQKRDALIQKAQESEKLKSSFLANMSHEIRTPMNSIIGFTDILLEKNIDEEQKHFLSIVNNSAHHLLSIINDILDISKIQSGNFTLNYTTFNIDELIQFVIAEQKVIYSKNKVDIIFNPQNEIQVYCDKGRIKQVLTNLLSNALKFTKKGFVEIGYSLKNNHLEFFVRDTGKGIENAAQQFVFERFRQVDDTMTREYEGTGLGLSITQSLVELHKGKIWFESEIEKGSTFFFDLPHKGQTVLKKTIKAKPTNSLSLKNKTFLVAEDNIDNFTYLKILLEKDNKVIHSRNGIETLEILMNEKIDLILMDIQMPDMDGHKCTQEIRKINTSLPIIAQTAFGTEQDRKKAIESGCNDYISKPIKKLELYSKINKYLEN